MLGIIDFGVGNLASVWNAFDQVEVGAQVVTKPTEAKKYSHLVLPGVGSFAHGMQALSDSGWADEIKEAASIQKPILGICLGMQLFFDESEEHGVASGLGLIPGRVKRLTAVPDAFNRIPHVGWNSIKHHRTHALFQNIKQHVDYYFVHSYCCMPDASEHMLATCQYGAEFAAAVANGTVVGLQFHPEKSQPAGGEILSNFAKWDGQC